MHPNTNEPVHFLFLSLSFSIHSECCCKSNKTPLLTTLDPSYISPITGSSSNSTYNGTQPEATMPPNYDEIDPPPSYATLFPGNKSTDTESSSTDVQPIANTSSESNQAATVTAAAATATTAVEAAACITANGISGSNSFSNAQQQQPSAPILPSSSTSN